MLDINELQRRLTKPRPGRAILFTGAGFSEKATNLLDNPIPLARHFAKDIAVEIGESPDLPLTLISEIYNEKKNDPSALLRQIKSTFTTKKVNDIHNRILAYPWKRIYTTNYDDVAEHVSSPDGTRCESFSRSTLPLNFEGSQRQIVHLNGFVGELTKETALDEFALTLSSYWDKSLFSSPWATTLRQDFELADIIVFLGYSLVDPDVSTLLGQNPSFREKTAVMQWSGLKAAEERFLQRFGTVHKIGNDGFANIIDSTMNAGAPKVVVSGPENFQEIFLPTNPPSIRVSDKDVDALLSRGIFNRDIFFASKINGGREYLVNRACVQDITQAAQAIGSQIVVHAELGNGKTLLTEQIIYSLLSKQFRVFVLDRRTDNFSYDIEFFARIAEPYIIIVEDLIAHRDAIEALNSQLSKARIVTTARSSAFEVKLSDIRHLFGADIKVLDTNKLRDEDISSLIEILDSGAYWKEFPRTRSKADKRRLIEKRCRKELASVILGVVESQVLDDRIRTLLNSVNDNQQGGMALILALCLNYVEMRPTFELLSELLGKDIFTTMNSLNDDFAKEFFAISRTEVIARSPVLSEYLLKNFVSDDKLIATLVIALAASSARYKKARWPAPGSEDTELGVLMGPEGGHGATAVYARVQA